MFTLKSNLLGCHITYQLNFECGFSARLTNLFFPKISVGIVFGVVGD